MRAKILLFACGAAALLLHARVALATDYLIHVGGMCSRSFLENDARLGAVPGWTSIDAAVDMTSDLDEAVGQLKAVLDARCLTTSGDSCRLYGYSNGAAAISKLLSVYGAGQWNIAWVLHSGSNEGGSELSRTGWLARIIGGCDIADEIDPTTYRTGWNHHDTDGRIIYQLAGRKGFARYLYATSPLLPGRDDGAVAMHSAGGYVDTGSYDDACGETRFTNHVPAYFCSFDRDHYEMKMKGLVCLEAQAAGGSCGEGGD